MSELVKDEGFTLLEVVTAVAILSMGLAVLYPIFGASPGRLQAAEKRGLAVEVLHSEMENLLLLEDWSSLPKQGEFDGWNWVIEGEVYSHVSDSETQAEFLFSLTGTIEHASPRYGDDIVLKRMIVRRN